MNAPDEVLTLSTTRGGVLGYRNGRIQELDSYLLHPSS